MTSMSSVEPDLAVPVPSRSPVLKRLLLSTLSIAALVLAGLYATHWWTAGRFIEQTDDAYIGANVTVIGPKVAGYIDEVLVTDNQQVKAGDLLIRLDSRDYRAHLAKAEGAVAAQEALLANLDATEQLQQAVIAQAHAGIDAAGAETARSRDDDARYKKLVSTSAVSVKRATGQCHLQDRPGAKQPRPGRAAGGAAPVERDCHPESAGPRRVDPGQGRT